MCCKLIQWPSKMHPYCQCKSNYDVETQGKPFKYYCPRKHFLCAFSLMKMLESQLENHRSLLLGVQLTINQHWSRLWLGTNQVPSHNLNQCWQSSMKPQGQVLMKTWDCLCWSEAWHPVNKAVVISCALAKFMSMIPHIINQAHFLYIVSHQGNKVSANDKTSHTWNLGSFTTLDKLPKWYFLEISFLWMQTTWIILQDNLC